MFRYWWYYDKDHPIVANYIEQFLNNLQADLQISVKDIRTETVTVVSNKTNRGRDKDLLIIAKQIAQFLNNLQSIVSRSGQDIRIDSVVVNVISEMKFKILIIYKIIMW